MAAFCLGLLFILVSDFADGIFQCISRYEKYCFSIQISLKCVRNGSFYNTSTSVLLMAWCWAGDTPLHELMVVKFAVNKSALIHPMLLHRTVVKPFNEPTRSQHCQTLHDPLCIYASVNASNFQIMPVPFQAMSQINADLDPQDYIGEITIKIQKASFNFFQENALQSVVCKMFAMLFRPWLIEGEWRIYTSLNWVIIGSDNGLSPVRRQAIIWTNAWILLIGPLGTNFSEILIEIQTFSFKKMHLKMSSAKWRPFCLGLNELICLQRLSRYGLPGNAELPYPERKNIPLKFS